MQQHGKTAGQACTMSTVFCLYLSFVSPHDACHAATKYLETKPACMGWWLQSRLKHLHQAQGRVGSSGVG